MVEIPHRKIINGKNYIFNEDTRRWVLVTGRSGSKYIREQKLTIIGDESTKVKAKYKKVLEKNSRSWKIVHYLRDKPTSITRMANSILSVIKPYMKNLFITVRAFDTEGDTSFRTLEFPVIGHRLVRNGVILVTKKKFLMLL